MRGLAAFLRKKYLSLFRLILENSSFASNFINNYITFCEEIFEFKKPTAQLKIPFV